MSLKEDIRYRKKLNLAWKASIALGVLAIATGKLCEHFGIDVTIPQHYYHHEPSNHHQEMDPRIRAYLDAHGLTEADFERFKKEHPGQLESLLRQDCPTIAPEQNVATKPDIDSTKNPPKSHNPVR